MIPIALEIIKLIIEQCTPPQVPKLVEAEEGITILIPAYNEEKAIGKTLDSACKLEYPIIVAVNGSTDNTAKVARNHPCKPLVIEIEQGNKTAATEIALRIAETPYVLIIDADTELPDKKLRYDPTHRALMAFPVIPMETKNLLQKLQDIEYRRSMFIGKPFTANDTFMASGACIMGHAPDLRAVPHSGVFAGEDTERSLCWHRKGGKIVFDVDRVFKTDVPSTWREFINQRRQKWNPGAYRLMPLVLSVILRKRTSWRLRLQLIYAVLAYVTDPLRVAALIVFYQWYPLIYLIYALCTALSLTRVGKHYLMFDKILICLTYPFYSSFLTILRLSVLVNKKSYRITKHKFTQADMIVED